MLKKIITNFIQKLKGRSAHQIKKSELDSFIDAFEANRESQPQSRILEVNKAQLIEKLRDHKS